MERRMDSLERAITNLGRPTDTALPHHPQARHKITTPMIVVHHQAPTQGEETFLDFIDIMIAMKTRAPTQDEESFTDMLVHMSVLNKTKDHTMTAIKMIAMPTMGVMTDPTTTSYSTWTRHLIASHTLMLNTMVIKSNLDVISGTILATTNMEEETRQMPKMREPTMDVINNLVKMFDNTIIVNQVKLVFNYNTNPMLWNLEDEEKMYDKLKFNMPKFKGEDDAEDYLSWALKVDKIFRIHNYSGAKKVAMASLEFEDYANTWWEQVVTLREVKGTKTVEEFYKEMELTMMRVNIQESENQTIARFFNGLNYPIKTIVEFQQYSNMVELVHQASKAERQVDEDINYSKSKSYFASKLATTAPTTSAKPFISSTPSKQPTIQSCMKQPVTSTASSKASTGPSNVTCFKCGTQGHKASTTQPQAIEDQRCNIFQTRAIIGGKPIKVIIDGGSCHNLASTKLCEKLNLTLRKHPHPYHVQWLSEKGNVKIQHTITVNFKIVPYEDTIECDVVPMMVCHMLLGLPWQYDKKAIHDGHSNVYTFKVKDKKFELRPMTPSQIIVRAQ
ncbi:hypothetical protein QYE76_049879 [Lolium multiflorum]|uniref:Retrotransposon gag domain-containing protein n=1 Tax=Lolium multiflorum TaxID=4521 RepID=A0AAD8WIW3_LOLMU|nr:hypothetical protein QYE76_049879 [Lolium multiflorum]